MFFSDRNMMEMFGLPGAHIWQLSQWPSDQRDL